MSTAIYLDTNVYMDFLLDRDSSAYRLLMRTLDCEFFIICSNLVVEELKHNGLMKEGTALIRMLSYPQKMKFVSVNDTDKNEAREILKTCTTHYADALHTVLAKRYGAKIIVTKNIKDFYDFEDISITHTDTI